MGSIRRLGIALIALLAVAGATPATAQETTQRTLVGPDGRDCDPCAMSATGESRVVSLTSGIEVTACEDSYEIDLYVAGAGELEWSGSPLDDAPCGIRKCRSEWSHWLLGQASETDPGRGNLLAEFCFLSAAGGEIRCNGSVTIARDDDDTYEYSMDQLCSEAARRFETEGEVNAGDIHLADAGS